MPIYMDRHEIPEAITATHVAEMHQEDLKIEHLYGCKGMTYWCDEKRRTAFCLIQAPNKKAIQDMHDHAHGEVPHRIIEVESAIVESFLGRIEDPEKSQNVALNIINDPAFRTIMVIGFKKKLLKDIRPELLNEKILEYNKSILKSTKKFVGRIVKQKSDYFLISFSSVTNAMLCAQEILVHFSTPYKNIQLDIGINAGVPVTEKEGIFEDTIKTAERFCNIIGGKVVISQEVKELYESENLNIKLKDINIRVLHGRDEKFINLLMDYTEKEWANAAFSAVDFSKKLGYSKSQLYRKMISITGKSPNNFIKGYRLDNAMKLLDKKGNTISETAFATGFNSPAYFSKCFMDNFGVLPSTYIQAYTQQ